MTNYIYEGSREGYSSTLSVFTPLPSETGIQEIYQKEFRPLGAVSDGECLEFDIQNNSMDYMMLHKTRFVTNWKISAENNTNLTEHDIVGFINLAGATAFQQVDLTLNQTVITTGIGKNYPYKATFDVYLNSSTNDTETILAAAGYIKDTAGAMDACEGTSNGGLLLRREMTAKSAEIQLSSSLYIDFLQTEKLLINGVSAGLQFQQSADKFRLMYKTLPADAVGRTAKHYSAHLLSAYLVVPFAKIHPSIILSTAKILETRPAIYSYNRTEVKHFNLTEKTTSFTLENIFGVNIPKLLAIGFIKASAYAGHNEQNPLNLEHFNIASASFEIDGVAPLRPFQPNIKKKIYSDVYAAMFNCREPSKPEAGLIKHEDWIDGYSMLVFDYENCKSDETTNPIKKGDSRLYLRFAEDLKQPVCMIAYGKFNSVVNIDKSRNVLLQT